MKRTKKYDLMILASGAMGLLVLVIFARMISSHRNPLHELDIILRQLRSEPCVWAGWFAFLLIGAFVGAMAAWTLSCIRARRTQVFAGAAVLVAGVATGIVFAVIKPMLAGLELPVILFGLSLLIWRYPHEVSKTPPNQAFEATV